VAASGGYYVAAPASEIFASPSTLTGSIGIFGFKVDLNGLLGHLGIASETYKRGAHADLFSISHGWNDEERALISGRMEQIYRRFLDTVAEGRGKPRRDRRRAPTSWAAVGSGPARRPRAWAWWIAWAGSAQPLTRRLGAVGVPVGPGGLPELVVLPRPGAVGVGRAFPRPGRPRGAAFATAAVAEGGTGILARLPYDIETK
jgi:protease-4